MLCVCQQLASTVQYLERSLLLFVTSASDTYQSVPLNSVLFSLVYASTDKKDVEACCHEQDSLMHDVSSSPTAVINIGAIIIIIIIIIHAFITRTHSVMVLTTESEAL